MNNKTTIRDFEPALFLGDEEMISIYLTDIFAEGTENEIRSALADVAKARNINDLALKMGIDRKELFNMFSENEALELSKVQKFLNAIGVNLSIVSNESGSLVVQNLS